MFFSICLCDAGSEAQNERVASVGVENQHEQVSGGAGAEEKEALAKPRRQRKKKPPKAALQVHATIPDHELKPGDIENERKANNRPYRRVCCEMCVRHVFTASTAEESASV